MPFEWDPTKRDRNLEKHGVDFVLAVRIFEGAVVQWQDVRRDYGEIRMIAVGQVDDIRLVVIYTQRGDAYRIISARRAGSHER